MGVAEAKGCCHIISSGKGLPTHHFHGEIAFCLSLDIEYCLQSECLMKNQVSNADISRNPPPGWPGVEILWKRCVGGWFLAQFIPWQKVYNPIRGIFLFSSSLKMPQVSDIWISHCVMWISPGDQFHRPSPRTILPSSQPLPFWEYLNIITMCH